MRGSFNSPQQKSGLFWTFSSRRFISLHNSFIQVVVVVVRSVLCLSETTYWWRLFFILPNSDHVSCIGNKIIYLEDSVRLIGSKKMLLFLLFLLISSQHRTSYAVPFDRKEIARCLLNSLASLQYQLNFDLVKDFVWRTLCVGGLGVGNTKPVEVTIMPRSRETGVGGGRGRNSRDGWGRKDGKGKKQLR